MVAQALFSPLDRVVAKYRRDVHQLADGATIEAIQSLENHLSRRLPIGHREFLCRHNGAALFRGSLRLRSTSEIAAAVRRVPQVVLFADGPGDQRWCWAATGRGGHVFGRWNGTEVEPLHGSFAGWLAGTIAALETRVTRDEDLEALRFEADPDDVHQQLRFGERELAAGRPHAAAARFQSATRADPGHTLAWQRLGEALAINDRATARRSWLQALRSSRLPTPWPGAPVLQPELLPAVRGAFADPEDWERELRRFLEDQVRDVTNAREFALLRAVGEELSGHLVASGRRQAARDVVADLTTRSKLFTWKVVPWSLLLAQAKLEFQLGQHDAAEDLLRRLQREAPDPIPGRAALLQGELAIIRQEPWAEDILSDACGRLDANDRLHAELLSMERLLRLGSEVGPELVAPLCERAAGQAPQSGGPSEPAAPEVQGLAQLIAGDAARDQGAFEAAAVSYQRAQEQADKVPDRELALRVELRKGDLALAKGNSERAEEHYRRSAQGFHDHQLPVREAWALLRLARLTRGPTPLLDAARERFIRSDLAHGVAAVDATLGDAGASLQWHLRRACQHAHRRNDAQRGKPPYERRDAERPERRLGAHRLATAACGERVVDALALEMASCADVIASGRARALDADGHVMRYVAAVDLLAGHRSYHASEVLLEHLMERTLEGPARHALQGAIARSPNAALVDGLLRCVEQPGNAPAGAVDAAAELLGLRREREAVPALRALSRPAHSPVVRRSAISALGRIGDRQSIPDVLACLDEAPLAERAALALLMLGDRRGVDFHGRALAEDRRDLSGSPGEIVGRYGGPSHLLLLTATADRDDERALGALQGLGLLGDPRAVPTLLAAISGRDRAKAAIASGALEILGGHREDQEEPGAKVRWHHWWEENRERLRDGVRHRDGQPFQPGLLIENMAHDDGWVRRTAYDELVITTGADLPFDGDGPWRIQSAHLTRWRGWWRVNREKYTAGRWYLDSQPVG